MIALLLQGKSNKQIALELGISSRTVEFHLCHIYEKLGVVSRTEAIIKITEDHLGESTGLTKNTFQVESTVASRRQSTENGLKPILRRIQMKYPFYILGVVVLVAIFAGIFILTNPPAEKISFTATVTQGKTKTAVVDKPTATPLPPQPTVTPTLTAMVKTQASFTGDAAHFVAENYPDGTKVDKGVTFTKMWSLQNSGSTTWTTDYVLKVVRTAYPLGKNLKEPYQIRLPKNVNPGETVEISANFTVPDADGTYEVQYQFQNNLGQNVTGDGNRVWLKIVVGNSTLSRNTAQAANVTLSLGDIQKSETTTHVEVCAQLPDTQDWNPDGVLLQAANSQTGLSEYRLKNAKNLATILSTNRCFEFEFAVGVNNYGTVPVSISIRDMRVSAENHLEANCARAKQKFANQYPGLDFTCGPIGFFYSNLKLPSGMTKDQADKLIMDEMEQAIYGNWSLSE